MNKISYSQSYPQFPQGQMWITEVNHKRLHNTKKEKMSKNNAFFNIKEKR